MIYDTIAIAIIIISFVIIIIILSRKFSVIASINTKALPEIKQEAVKDNLLYNRLKRKFASLRNKTLSQTEPLKNKFQDGLKYLYKKITDLENSYRKKVADNKVGNGVVIDNKTKDLLEEAQELSNKEQFEEAERKYISIISLDHKNVEAYKGLGEVYFRKKDYVHAKEIFNHVLKLASLDEEAYVNLGMIAFKEGNLEEARKDYAQSLALNNKVAVHHIDLGEVCLALGENKKALDCFQEAVKLEPNNPRNLDLLLETSIKTKNKKLALETYENFRQVNPENEKLAEFKERIDHLE